MKQDVPTLTRAEAEVMQILWARGRSTVHDVVAAMARAVAYTTALTIVRILEKKGYVRHEADPEGGRAFIYVPAVAQAEARREHVRDLVRRLFDGKPQDLLAGLVDEEKLTPRELEALRARIDSRLGPKKKEGKR